MSAIDPRMDAYISSAAPFAVPILNHLRELVHIACPEVKETMKWSCPHFDYNKSILCGMAAFKQHATFGFWLSSQMSDPHNVLSVGEKKNSAGHLGQLKSLKDMPSDKILIKYIKEAMSLIDKGVKLKKSDKPVKSEELEMPSYFADALKKNKKVAEVYKKFSLFAKKEYVEWLTEAKSEATRTKRMQMALQWIQEGSQDTGNINEY